MKTKSLKELQDELLPKYLETPPREEMERSQDDKLLLISILAALGSFVVVGATLAAMIWIINIIL